jgi:hypothetical protein
MPPLRKSAPRWGRLAAWTGGTLAVLVVMVYFGASYGLNCYLRSDAFLALLNRKTSVLLNAEGRYFPIHCNGFSFYSDGYSAHGAAGSPLKELMSDQIRAEFEPAGLFEGVWKVSSLQVQRVKVVLDNPPQTVADTPAPLPASTRAPGFSWIPDRFELQRAKIEEAALVWTPPGREGSLEQMRLILEPDGHDLVATGYGGHLKQTGWPELAIDHLKIRCRYPDLFLTDSLFQLSNSETFNVSGQASLGPSRALDLLVQFNGIGISPYLPQDWRASVKGNASGEVRITGSLQSPESVQVSGNVTLTGGQLEALPILEKIAAFTRTLQFRQFALQKAQADFVWTPAGLTLSHLNAESEGLIRLIGSCRVEQGTLQGEFQLGVAPSTLRWLPGSRERVFTQEHDGYVWTPLKVSGPLNHLNEDLTARLTVAAGEEVIQGVKGTIESGTRGLFDLLKQVAP